MTDVHRRGIRGSALVAATTLGLTLGITAPASAADGLVVSGELVRVSNDVHPTLPGDVVGDEYLIETEAGRLLPVDLPAAYEDFEAGTTIVARLAGPDADGTRDVLSATLTEPAEVAGADWNQPASAHHAYVVVIADAMASGDITAAQADQMTTRAAEYWVRESRGAISSFGIADRATLVLDGSCASSYTSLWNQAAALFPGVSFSDGNHLVVYSPSTCSYPYTGIAVVGSSLGDGGVLQIVDTSWSTVAHELGHNFSLRHANLEYVTPTTSPDVEEYYGAFGPMSGRVGAYPPATLEAGFQEVLHLPGRDTHRTTLTWPGSPATTEVPLQPSTSDTGVTSVTFTDPSDGARYFVEYRAGAGADAGTFYTTRGLLSADGRLTAYEPGVHITRIDGGALTTLSTFDGTDRYWATHQAGEAYVPQSKRFAVQVTALSASAATVAITLGDDGGAPAPQRRGPTSATTLRVPAVTYPARPQATVTVAGAADGDRVEFFYGTTRLGSVGLTGGAASWAAPAWLPGRYLLTARYLGSATRPASEASATVTVNKAIAVTRVSAAGITYGAQPKVSVSVTPSSSTVALIGKVDLYRGTVKVATLSLVGGRATWTGPVWNAGTYTLTAKYLGSATYAASSSAAVKVTVAKARPVVTVTNVSTVRVGSRATVSVTLNRVAATAPTGTVTVLVGGKVVSAATGVTSTRAGVYSATIVTGTLPAGRVTVYYSGNANLAATTYTTKYVVG